MKTVRDILWQFHIELREQQQSGRSVTEGNTEIIAHAQSDLCSAVDGLKKERPRNLSQDEFRAGYSQAIEDVKAMIRSI